LRFCGNVSLFDEEVVVEAQTRLRNA
jgi:hypothetical protein